MTNVKSGLMDYLGRKIVGKIPLLSIYRDKQGVYVGENTDYIDPKGDCIEESMRMAIFCKIPQNLLKQETRTDAISTIRILHQHELKWQGARPRLYARALVFKTILETGKDQDDWQKSRYYRYWMHMAHPPSKSGPTLGIRTKKSIN